MLRNYNYFMLDIQINKLNTNRNYFLFRTSILSYSFYIILIRHILKFNSKVYKLWKSGLRNGSIFNSPTGNFFKEINIK